ncbi:MAG: NfeD family protein [Thermoanaerobaculia bacterium]
MSWWIWVLAGLFLLAIEFATTTMHIGLFAVGALVVAVLVAFGLDLPLWSQLLIFTSVSLIALLFIRPVIMRKLNLRPTTVVDSLAGETATATTAIDADGEGKVELRGSTWMAKNSGASPLRAGDRCLVERVDGLVLYVRSAH